jgi:hypothetical protein
MCCEDGVVSVRRRRVKRGVRIMDCIMVDVVWCDV